MSFDTAFYTRDLIIRYLNIGACLREVSLILLILYVRFKGAVCKTFISNNHKMALICH